MDRINNYNNLRSRNISAQNNAGRNSDAKILQEILKRMWLRCEKEVPENGIFTPVTEKFEDKTKNVFDFELGCEYAKTQTSKKKDLRQLYLQKQKDGKPYKQILKEGTKKEILDFLKQEYFIKEAISGNTDTSKRRQMFAPSYGIISRETSPSFCSAETQNPNKERIEALRKKYEEAKSYSMSDELTEYYTKRLQILYLIDNADFPPEQTELVLDLLSKNYDTELLQRAVNLNPEQCKRIETIEATFDIKIPSNNIVDIAELEESRYNKLIEEYNKKADESSYKETFMGNQNHFFPYSNYKTDYLEKLLPVFSLQTPFYEQAIEFLDNGTEPVFLKNLQNTILDEKQKERANYLINKQIIPHPEILQLDNDLKFDLAVRFTKDIKGFPIDGITEKANKYGADEKEGKRFIEVYDRYLLSGKKISFFNMQSSDLKENYRSFQLEEIEKISEFSDEDYKRTFELLDMGISFDHIPECINCGIKDSQIERMKELLNKKFSGAIRIASDDRLYEKYLKLTEKMTPQEASKKITEEEEKADKQKYIDNGFDELKADILSKLHGKTAQRASILIEKGMFIFGIEKYTDEKTYNRILECFNKGIQSIDVYPVLYLNNADYQKALSLVAKGISVSSAVDFLQYDEEKYQKLLSLTDKGLDAYLLKPVMELTDLQYERFWNCIDIGCESYEAINIAKFDDNIYQKTVYLIKRGIQQEEATRISDYDGNLYERILYLINQGYKTDHAVEISSSDDLFKQALDDIKSIPDEIRDFYNSEECEAKIKKNSQGKYQKEIMEIFNPEAIKFPVKKSFIDSGMKVEDFLSSLQKFSKSTFKLAYDTPNQYLSGIDLKYTEKVNGKYPQLPDKVKKEQQNQIKKFFERNMCAIFRALKYLDTDTVNQMMDKRTQIFEEALNELNILTDENYELLSELIKCKSSETGKPMTAKEKIQFCQIMEIFQKCDLDKSKLKEMISSDSANLHNAKKVIQNKILENAGFTPEESEILSKRELQFNDEYMYTILINEENVSDIDIDEAVEWIRDIAKSSTRTREDIVQEFYTNTNAPEAAEIFIDMYDNINKYSEEEMKKLIRKALKVHKENNDLYIVVREAIKENFSNFITNTENKYGKINKETAKEYANRGIDFNEWLHPTTEPVDFIINNRPMKIKMWERNPNEDLFIGNKTSCCTAIGTRTNGAATPAYLLSQAFNVVELLDENNKSVGMSRIFMANIDNKPSVVMDNIELNQNFLKYLSEDNKKEVRDNFFKYINNLAENITENKDTQVYFSTSYLKIDSEDLNKTEKKIDFIGEASQDSIYINCQKGWFNPHNLKDQPVELYIVPK